MLHVTGTTVKNTILHPPTKEFTLTLFLSPVLLYGRLLPFRPRPGSCELRRDQHSQGHTTPRCGFVTWSTISTHMEALLDELKLSHLASPFRDAGLTIEGCVLELHEHGRPALLARLRAASATAPVAGKVANALAKTLRAGPPPSHEHRLPNVGPAVGSTPPPPPPPPPPPDPELTLVRDAEALRLAIASGATIDLAPLMLTAARTGHVECASILLNARASPEVRRPVDGLTPLMICCSRGHTTMAEALLAAGADTHSHRPDGQTALMSASRLGHANCVAALLRSHAEVDQRMHHGWSALLLASLEGHETVVRLLLNARAAVDGDDAYGSTPLSKACQVGHARVAAALLEAAADPNRQRAGGLTPLAYAALEGREECAGLLLRARAALDTADEEGFSPLTHAAHCGRLQCVRLLLDAAANPCAARPNGFSAVHAAAAAGHASCLAALLEFVPSGWCGLCRRGPEGACEGGRPERERDVEWHARRGEGAAACLAALAAAGVIPAAEQPADSLCAGDDDDAPSEAVPGAPPTLVAFRMPPGLLADECWQVRQAHR